MRRLAAISVLVAVSLAAAAPAADAAPTKLKTRFESIPQFPVRWLSVNDKTAVISDLEGRIAGLRTSSGSLSWRREWPGLNKLFAVDDDIIVVGDELAVIRGTIGTIAWRRDRGCTTAAGCRERAWAADSGGVYVSAGTRRAHDLVARIALHDGSVMWKIPVDHARKVLVDDHVVVIQESHSPWPLRFVAHNTGEVLGSWTRRMGGAPRPATKLMLDGARLVALDTRPQGSALLDAALVDRVGNPLLEAEVGRPEGVLTHPIWTTVVGETLWSFAPRPMVGGDLVKYVLDGVSTAETTRVPHWRPPVRVGDLAVFAERRRRRGHVTALPLSKSVNGFERRLPRPDAPDYDVWDAGGEIVVIGHGEPASLAVLDPGTGTVTARATLALDGATVVAVAPLVEGYLIAAPERIVGLGR